MNNQQSSWFTALSADCYWSAPISHSNGTFQILDLKPESQETFAVSVSASCPDPDRLLDSLTLLEQGLIFTSHEVLALWRTWVSAGLAMLMELVALVITVPRDGLGVPSVKVLCLGGFVGFIRYFRISFLRSRYMSGFTALLRGTE